MYGLLLSWCELFRVDGGRFRGDVVMQIIRIDVFDFKIKLSEPDFDNVKFIANTEGISIAAALILVIDRGITDLVESLTEGNT
ncbi:hypothetical protein ES703_38070 [subsurface metagenome]